MAPSYWQTFAQNAARQPNATNTAFEQAVPAASRHRCEHAVSSHPQGLTHVANVAGQAPPSILPDAQLGP
jgi:hypothetical protein